MEPSAGPTVFHALVPQPSTLSKFEPSRASRNGIVQRPRGTGGYLGEWRKVKRLQQHQSPSHLPSWGPAAGSEAAQTRACPPVPRSRPLRSLPPWPPPALGRGPIRARSPVRPGSGAGHCRACGAPRGPRAAPRPCTVAQSTAGTGATPRASDARRPQTAESGPPVREAGEMMGQPWGRRRGRQEETGSEKMGGRDSGPLPPSPVRQ